MENYYDNNFLTITVLFRRIGLCQTSRATKVKTHIRMKNGTISNWIEMKRREAKRTELLLVLCSHDRLKLKHCLWKNFVLCSSKCTYIMKTQTIRNVCVCVCASAYSCASECAKGTHNCKIIRFSGNGMEVYVTCTYYVGAFTVMFSSTAPIVIWTIISSFCVW